MKILVTAQIEVTDEFIKQQEKIHGDKAVGFLDENLLNYVKEKLDLRMENLTWGGSPIIWQVADLRWILMEKGFPMPPWDILEEGIEKIVDNHDADQGVSWGDLRIWIDDNIENKESFEVWESRVAQELCEEWGMSPQILIALPLRDWFDEGLCPYEVAKRILLK